MLGLIEKAATSFLQRRAASRQKQGYAQAKALFDAEFKKRFQDLRMEKLRFRSKYDAANTTSEAFLRHWENADTLSPNAANDWAVRKHLRSRSRFEVVENNPYLKGIVLTVANDMVGSGPKLQITDERVSPESRRFIESEFSAWAEEVKYRQQLWSMRVAKVVDGEAFKVALTDRQLEHPVKINWKAVEADQVTSQHNLDRITTRNEIDGVRFDPESGRPLQYYLLETHPGETLFTSFLEGTWIKRKFITHWFRKDRPWLRGIPELTPSLPLCALLRRFTLASVKAAETAADFAAVLESEAPANTNPWTDGPGSEVTNEDDFFDTFPIEQGMFVTLPYGYKLSQLEAKHPGVMFNGFVDHLLREIARPLLVPFNYAAGSSQDSNMASAVVDVHIYISGQTTERLSCKEEVLDPDFSLWWERAYNVRGFLPADVLQLKRPPRHTWGWDRVGLEHTDPAKVANAIDTLHKAGHLTDRDIQEGRYNRSLENWQREIEEEMAFRKRVGLPIGETQQPSAGDNQDSRG